MKAAPFGVAALLTLAACPNNSSGVQCGDAGTCPVNDLCIYSQCEAPGAVLQNLSAVVYPSDPNLAPQQYLPSDLTPINGAYIIDLLPPQQLVGHLGLPASCFADDADAGEVQIGYPIALHFETPSLIPSISTSYDFVDNGFADTLPLADGGANIIGVLPSQFDFARRITPATACTTPILGIQDVTPGPVPVSGPYSSVGNLPDAGVTGIVNGTILPASPDDILTAETASALAVRVILASGTQAGEVVSADGTLSLSDAGGLAFSLPALVSLAVSPENHAAGCFAATCASFTLEVGPANGYLTNSSEDFPVFDLAVQEVPVDAALVVDLGPSSGIFQPRLPIPVAVTASFPVTVTVTDALGLLPASVNVDIATTDVGLFGCDGGCSFDTERVADPSFVIDLLPGNYLLTLEAPPPDGETSLEVTVQPDGGLVTADGGPATAGSILDGGSVELVATSPQHVSGTALKPANQLGAVVGGQAEILTLPDLTPIALAGLDAGTFDLLVPPGPNYLLLIEPSNGTSFAAYRSTLTVQPNQDVIYAPFHVPQAGVLSGVVRLLPAPDAGSAPAPLANALIQFYSVTSDPGGEPVAFPITSALTDDQGNWTALGPTSE